MKRVHLIIRGKVQGVYYRQSSKEKADELGLCGWVRNRQNGTVEAVVEGAPAAVTSFIDWCHSGPSHARVDGVDCTSGEPVSLSGGFTVRPTA